MLSVCAGHGYSALALVALPPLSLRALASSDVLWAFGGAPERRYVPPPSPQRSLPIFWAAFFCPDNEIGQCFFSAAFPRMISAMIVRGRRLALDIAAAIGGAALLYVLEVTHHTPAQLSRSGRES